MTKIYPILLAGGSGARLWPLSRKSYPKQFSGLVGSKSLFQQSALRLISSDWIDFAPHITITNSDFRFIVAEQLQEVGIDPKHIIIEPESKNTAPAILAASLYAHAIDPDAILLVAPSDHVIPESEKFHLAIQTGLQQVKIGKFVTFGISPTRAETGYGYLEVPQNEPKEAGTSAVVNFVEKPNLPRAKQMVKAGNYLWNAGIFLFKAADMIASFENFNPNALKLAKSATQTAKLDLGFFRLNPQPWAKLENVSIDYAIMEKAQNLVAVRYSSKWTDLGDWDAVWLEMDKDFQGNTASEGAHAIDCSNSFLRSESVSQEIVGLGLESIIAIAMPDAVLVAQKNRAQDVKKVVDYLKSKNIAQAEIFPKDHRPWGWFESLVLREHFQVKRIFVKPGASLSLQSHRYRSEHWVVVKGTAKVTIDDETKFVDEGQSVYVPLGAIHRMENTNEDPVVIIEVQIGSYLGEDDIVRYEDVYQRN